MICCYNKGVVNGPLQGPSKSGRLLFAQRKNSTAILSGSVAPAANAGILAVRAAVGKIKLAFEQ